MRKRMIAGALCLCMAAGLMPTAALAKNNGKAIQLGTSALDTEINTANAATIYFGQNDAEQPGAWRVIGYDSEGVASTTGNMTLLAAGNMGRTMFDSDGYSNKYATSDLKSKVDALAEKLTTEENAAVIPRTLISGGYSGLDTDCVAGVQVDGAVFWSLSIYEANEVGNDIRALSTENQTWEMYYWWLRSPSYSDGCVAAVDGAGVLHTMGYGVIKEFGVRPAFNLNLNSVLFTSAAVGGKSASGMDSGLTAIEDYTGNEWKLTLLGESRNFDVTKDPANGNPGDTITLHYTGATTGTNEYISVIIADENGAQYYGRVAQPTDTDGTVEITIPSGLADGTYTLYVFSEQYNGDYKTDYASSFAEVSLTVEDTTAPTLSNGSATRDSETAATVKFTSSEAGTYYYEVVESGADAPTIGTTGAGTSCDTTEQTISLTNLSGTSAKDIYIVAKDAAENVSQPLKITIPAIYTLIVNLNGGNGATTGGEYTEDEVINIDAGTRSGYRFAGWTSSNGGSFADASSPSTTFTMPANDTTITANWKKKSSSSCVEYNLNFDTNGGDAMSTAVEQGNTPIDLDQYVPTREGYEFVGWYADEDLTKPIDTITLTESATIYAKWEKIEEEIEEEEELIEEEQEEEREESLSFSDVRRGDWFYEAVSYAVSHDLMSGMGGGIFSPNTPLQREMFAVILWNLEGNPAPEHIAKFLDVTSDKYYAEAIAWANENGIVAGFGDTFGVGLPITREQFAVMLHNYAQYKGYDVSVGEDTNILSYPDALEISGYAFPAMQWACGAGIMSGNDDGTLNPQGQATRAEAATMLMNFCENVK